MSTTVKTGWLKNNNGEKFAPKTLTSQVQTSDGILLEDKIQADLDIMKEDILNNVSIDIDDALSPDSTNPVQNKVIDSEFEAVSTAMNALDSAIDNKADKVHNHDDIYYTEAEVDTALAGKADKDHTHDLSAYETTTNAAAKLAEAKSYSDTNLATAKSYTDTKTADLASTTVVDNKINTHNTSTSAHNDIRVLISDLTTKLNNFLDVDDTTSDQLSEVLTLIENNKGTLESLTTSKINVSDIIDNLTTASTSKVLSANQGVAIKALIDALQTEIDALQTEVDGKADASHTHDDRYYTETEVDTAIADSKHMWYGTCPTAANTAAKVVTTNTGNFSLTAGNIVYVLFTYAAYSNSTLNVDGTGAIAIKTAGTTGVVTYQWAANEAIGFVYDGTYFRMLDGMVANTTYYGMTKLSSSTSSTSTTMAATPSAVKSAYDLADEAKALASSAGATAGQAMTAATNASTTANQAKSEASTATTAATNAQNTANNAASAAANAQTTADSKAPLVHIHTKLQITDFPTAEAWTFTLEDGSTVTKGVYVGKAPLPVGTPVTVNVINNNPAGADPLCTFIYNGTPKTVSGNGSFEANVGDVLKLSLNASNGGVATVNGAIVKETSSYSEDPAVIFYEYAIVGNTQLTHKSDNNRKYYDIVEL